MNKKMMTGIMGTITLLVGLFALANLYFPRKMVDVKELSATVLRKEQDTLTLQDKDNIIYTFDSCDADVQVGDNLLIKYTGLIDKNMEMQDVIVSHCDAVTVMNETTGVPDDWQDHGIFQQYYTLAYNQVKKMSTLEKIAQILLVRYPDSNQDTILKNYQFGGYVFFEKDFRGKTKAEIQKMIQGLQDVVNIPILTAVDEEGGKVVRVSSNTNLRSTKFESPSSLYQRGGFDLIQEDTKEKSNLLKSLGLNLNLAPVVDVATDANAYMYDRTLGQGTANTATYAKTVIEASRNTGVSYTLKHFPGYGNNADTHTGSATDNRSYNDILTNDLPPFKAGIEAGAEAVLVSHNIVTSVDANQPASLSASVHNLLRNHLGFTGIIITDDLSMGATSSIDDVVVKAVLAGNDLIITTDYQSDMNSLKQAIQDGTIPEDLIEKLATRVIAWKYYKGLLFENQK